MDVALMVAVIALVVALGTAVFAFFIWWYVGRVAVRWMEVDLERLIRKDSMDDWDKIIQGGIEKKKHENT